MHAHTHTNPPPPPYTNTRANTRANTHTHKNLLKYTWEQSHTNIYKMYICIVCTYVPTHAHSPVGALVCQPALFPMRVGCALWLAVIDDGNGEADHLDGPIYTGRKSNQLC